MYGLIETLSPIYNLDQTHTISRDKKMSFLRVLKEVLTPGSPEFKAHLTRLSDREAELVKCLHRLDQPAIRTMRDASDEAAEF